MGIEGTGEPGTQPTQADVTASLNEVIKALKEGSTDLGKLASSLSWLNTSERTADPERLKRATKRVNDGRVSGDANIAQHYLSQLAEELVEVSVELTGDTQVRQHQKQALKVIRFGATTVIKDGQNEGKTNGELFTELTGKEKTDLPSLLSVFNDDYAPVEAPMLTMLGDGPVEQVNGNLSTDNFFTTNLITAYIVNRKQRGDGTARPLVTIPNFFKKLFSEPNKMDTELAKELLGLTEDAQLTNEQIAALFAFKTFHDVMAPTVRQNLTGMPRMINGKNRRAGQPKDVWFRDWTQFLPRDDNGNLVPQENVITALVVAAWIYTDVNARGNGRKGQAEINRQTGRDEGAPAEIGDENLIFAGERMHFAARDMGRIFSDVLGAETVKNAPDGTLEQLQLAFGGMAMSTLLTGWENNVDGQITNVPLFQRIKVDVPVENSDQTKQAGYIRPIRDADWNVNATVQWVLESINGSDGVVDKLFGSEEGRIFPIGDESSVEGATEETKKLVKKKDKFLQKVIKKGRAVTKTMRNIANSDSNWTWKIREDQAKYRGHLDEDIILWLQGAKPGEEALATIHEGRREAQIAKNNEAERALANLAEFEAQQNAKGLKSFFLPPVYWLQQRAGILSNVINPQTNKFIRHNISATAWNTEIDLNNPEIVEDFLIAVGLGLDLAPDKNNRQQVLQSLEQTMNEPQWKKAIEAVRAMNKLGEGEPLSREQQIDIFMATRDAENWFTFDALTQYVKYLDTPAGGKFTTDLMFEIDGVTNGPALAQIMAGVVNTARAARMGFFSKDSKTKDYPNYKSDLSNKDVYELGLDTTTRLVDSGVGGWAENSKGELSTWRVRVAQRISGSDVVYKGKQQKGFQHIFNASRNAFKTPTTSMVFGAGLKKAISSMGIEIVDNYYAALEAAVNAKDIKTVNEIIEEMNYLLAQDNDYWDSDKTQTYIPFYRGDVEFINTVLGSEYSLQPVQIRSISKAFYDTYGKAIEQSMMQNFGEFMSARAVVNESAEAAFKRYFTAYEHLIEKRLAEKDLPKTDKGEIVQNLTRDDLKAIEKELEGIAPLLDTVFSKMDGERGGTLMLEKIVEKISEDTEDSDLVGEQDAGVSHLNKQTVVYGQPIPYNNGTGDKFEANALRRIRKLKQEPGVAPYILWIHSFDSAISGIARNGHPVLNIHDAHGMGINDMHRAGQRLNQVTYELLRDNSLALNMLDTLENSFNKMDALIKDDIELELKLANILMGEGTPFETALDREWLASQRLSLLKMEQSKLETVLEMGFVNQYGHEGGTYEVTVDDDAKTTALLKTVEGRINVARQALKGAKATTEKESTSTVEEETAPTFIPVDGKRFPLVSPADVPGGNKLTESRYGQLGMPLGQPMGELVEFFMANPETTVGKTLETLATLLDPAIQGRDSVKFYTQVIKAVKSIGDMDTPVSYTLPDALPDTDAKLRLSKTREEGGSERAVGTFLGGDSRSIAIRSHHHKYSRVDFETVLHEILHSVSQGVINENLDVPFDSTWDARKQEVWNAVQDLESIRKSAATFVQDNESNLGEAATKRYTYLTSNVHEMLVGGFSNANFAADVLGQIPAPENTATKSGGALTGLQGIIKAITTLFFPKSRQDAALDSAFGVFLTRSMQVLEANQERENNLGPRQQSQEASQNELPWADDETISARDQFTAVEIFSALASNGRPISPTTATRLTAMLERIVSTVYKGSDAFQAKYERLSPTTADDVYLMSKAGKKTPFASDSVAQLSMTHQEAYALEAIELTLSEGLPLVQASAQEMRKLYKRAKALIKPEHFYEGDWLRANPEARREAERKHAFIFSPKEGTDYLSRFVSLGLAYEPLSNLLADLDVEQDQRGVFNNGSLGANLAIAYEKFLSFLSDFFLGSHRNDSIQERMDRLAGRIADVTARHRANLARREDTIDNIFDKAENYANRGGNKLKAAVAAASDKLAEKAPNAFVRGGAHFLAMTAGNRSAAVMKQIGVVRDKMFTGRVNFLTELFIEAQGETDANANVHALLNEANMLDRQVKQMMKDTTGVVRKGFAKLSKEQSESVTTGLRLDLGNLLETRNLLDIDSLLTDGTYLRSEVKAKRALIAKLVDDMTLSQQDKQWITNYIHGQTRATGMFMATNINESPLLMLNAYNLSRLAGTYLKDQIKGNDRVALEAVIDELMSLEAIRFTDNGKLNTLSQLILQENRKGDGTVNGVEAALKMHKAMQDDIQQQEFNGDPTQMIKGYTAEIYDPKVELTSATEAEGAELLEAGYAYVSELEQDKADVTKPRGLYKRVGMPMSESVTGMFHFGSGHIKGTTVHGRLYDPMNADPDYNGNEGALKVHRAILNRKAKQLANAFPADWTPKRTADADQYMAPVINAAGDTANFRYMMNSQRRDELLMRDNRVEKILGKMAGQAINKKESPLLNAKGVKLLKDQYQLEVADNPEAFIEMGPDSDDAVIRERYKLLPEHTKKEIRRVWGRDGMKIRRDTYNIAFAYRKFSIGDVLNRDPALRSSWQNHLIKTLESLPLRYTPDGFKPLGKRLAYYLVNAENFIQAAVTIVKDIFVIKNLVTLMGNEFSNLTIAVARGMSIPEYIRKKVEATQATEAYRTKEQQVNELGWQLRTGLLKGKARTNAEAEVIRLKSDMAKNPVHELMEAGMYQTLVEDIAAEEDDNAYKSRLATIMEDKTQWVPGPVKSGVKGVLVTHDTSLYKMLNNLTTMSDFTSRYALHHHLTTRRMDRMDKATSLRVIRAAFVNYDVPTHKGVQYLNDMGVLMFTKYYMRIQAAIFDAAKNHPARSVAMLLSAGMFDFQTIFDSSMLRDPVPGSLASSILELPGAIPELVTLRWIPGFN